MPTTIQITSNNYDGQTAVITFYPDLMWLKNNN